MKEITIFYIPTPDKSSAEKIACDLIDRRLISCANIIEGHSIYNWGGKLSKNDESLLLAKTFVENTDAVLDYVERTHPYETPLIGHYNMKVNSKYFEWMKEQINK